MLASLRLAAIVLTALALVPAGAHLFAMPNKLPMSAEDYFAAQAAYRGWALFAIPLFGAIAANLALGTALRRRDGRAWPAFAAAALILATLAIFFTWTFPANQATQNWTVMPENWETLRRQWEYSHAVNAVLTFAALCLVAGEATGRGRGAGSDLVRLTRCIMYRESITRIRALFVTRDLCAREAGQSTIHISR